jgi:predicted molibdopterin-dependent oxidoreductase YjgC
VERVLTTCPGCACGCGVYLHVRDGRLAGSAPSEHHPIAQGRLCARGWNAHEASLWGPRLTRPLVRRGGRLEPATWDEALEHARAALSALVERGAPVGVLGSARATNEENYLAARLARGALGTGNLGSCLRDTYRPVFDAATSVLGRPPAGTLDDVAAADVAVVVEGDLAATHPQAAHALVKALRAGGRVVTVGSVRTQVARLATLHIPCRPGERTLALSGLVAALLREGRRDLLSGLEQLVESLTPLVVGDALRTAAGWLAAAERPTLLFAPDGATRAGGTLEGRAVGALAALAGAPGTPGASVLILPERGNLRGACEMGVEADRLPGGASLADTEAAARLAAVWGRRPALGAGLGAEALVEGARGLVIVADDPPAVLPSGSRAADALHASECLVILDAFVTRSVGAALVALPIASYAESEGTATAADGRVQAVRAAVPPPGEARPGWLALAELSAALGLPHSYRDAADVTREISVALPEYATVAERVLADTWGASPAPASAPQPVLPRLDSQRAVSAAPAVLALEEPFDWGSDPLVSFSPTLRRDHVSRRKLYPRGLVGMCPEDAERLGVRQGWAVRLTSEHGEATVPVVLRRELPSGVLLVPFGFRDNLAPLLAGRSEVAVRAERAT